MPDLLQVIGVSKQYVSVKAVDNLSFSVKQGEIFALLGPNGAGKSSLVRMLVGFTYPDSGTIAVNIDGQAYQSIPHQSLGYLPEDRGLYAEKTVQQNLLYFAKLRGVEKNAALAQIQSWLTQFDLSDRAHERLKSLSKGNQQKVQLISAVLHKPKVVLLDEPFSGLDPINQEKVVVFLEALKAQGMTVILSAHQMAMVEKLADRMLLMNHGQAVLYGTLAEIKQDVGVGIDITVSFSEATNYTELNLGNYKVACTQLSQNKIKFELSDSSELNLLLADLSKSTTLQGIETKTMDLHQLYLKAIESHQGKVQSQENAHVS
ncbi:MULTISPECIES: ABC transporter ATP-binding protein [unclassified Pseudoalteromonas]|uniref:ABC transporter ATP-binding protein n=1 Tax=unclassified Pseudoalteromonas TaxID=194690 RepID=UPI001F226DF7|nr:MULTISPECIES: ATP-binding cassette domain-containing protein [unclassified Pseudoalteromonas]MCF2828460.1 ATP-binding cassette domain-containing protein [Pseudoalteromonas sp. OF5H-5]MCF2830495.1 ATP-binding cassette domain-containing protein [Pseudoalteromonas sp. DL2-H6]MCF2924548.1 ATP-binding cassette domain-containing protein [Pseudoalteromonas sp. DL2-H1]